MSKLNLFIDAGNVKNTNTSELLSEIALVKNMEHIESVFVFSNGKNVLKKAVDEVGDDAKKAARDEYAQIEITESDSLNKKPNKIVIYKSDNADLIGKFEDKLKPLKNNSLMICVPNDAAELDVLSLFTQKTPTAFKNIQLFVPKGDYDKLVMNMVKDAKRLRELKINIRGAQAGGFLGLFGKKKYDVKAAEIVKKLLKDNKNYDDVKDDVIAELQKYYGYAESKTGLTGSALKKQTEAKNNVARALHTVEKLLADAVTPKKEKTPSFSTIRKMNDAAKAAHQRKKGDERVAALKGREIEIEKGESADILNTHLKFNNKEKTRLLRRPDLIIRHEADKSRYPSDTPCIVYNNTTLSILDLLLTAQFSEPTRLRNLFYKGTGTKKSGIISKVKKGISKLGHEDLSYTRKRRSSSSKRVAAKINSKAISRTPMEKKKESSKLLNNAKEAIATKKAELKRLGFALFGEKRTKKKQLQANIAELEKNLKAPNTSKPMA